MKRLLLILVLISAFLMLPAGVHASARHHRTTTRQVWIWADYWSCATNPGTVPALPPNRFRAVIQLDGSYLICVWQPSHWAAIPRSEHCTIVPLDPAVPELKLITVCK